MLTLLLLRHAKSAWPRGMADQDRCLAERGKIAAPMIGAFMEKQKLHPDLVLVSPATRAQETWELVKPFVTAGDEREEPRIYEAQAPYILDVIRDIPATVGVLMLVGHNPGMEDLSRMLSHSGEASALERMRYKYPTAGLAILQFDAGQWADIDWQTGYLADFVTPKSLGAGEDD